MWNLPAAYAAWAPVVLRLVLGIIFFAHGSQKLFGWFDGGGPGGTADFLAGLGFKPLMFWAVVLIIVEFVGAILLIIGFLVPYAAGAIVISQLVAVALIHWKLGFFAGAGGFEFNLALIAIGIALILAGAGPISIDSLLRRR